MCGGDSSNVDCSNPRENSQPHTPELAAALGNPEQTCKAEMRTEIAGAAHQLGFARLIPDSRTRRST